MALSDTEKKAAIAKVIQRVMIAESGRQGRMITLEELNRRYLPEVTYPTFVAIATGKRLPAWENAVLLGRVWPEIWQILELPDTMPDTPEWRAAMRMFYDLPEEQKALVRNYITSLAKEEKSHS